MDTSKRRHWFSASIMLALVFTMGLNLVPMQAAAQEGDARLHFKTEAAEVRFEATDPVTGIVTSVWVYAADDTLPERISKVVVAVDQHDPAACTEPDVEAEAEPGGGCVVFSAECYAELGDDAFWVDPNQLDSAGVAGRVSCFEKVTGSQIQLDIWVSWTGVGETTTFRDNALYHPDKAPGSSRGTETQHIRAVNRSATVTGSISDGFEEYFVPTQGVDAWIARAQQVNT